MTKYFVYINMGNKESQEYHMIIDAPNIEDATFKAMFKYKVKDLSRIFVREAYKDEIQLFPEVK